MATPPRYPGAQGRPALIPGFLAVDIKQRVLGRLTDAGFVLMATLLPNLILFVFGSQSAALALVLLMVMMSALIVIGIVVPLRTSSPAGYAALGLRFLDVQTGQQVGGKVIAKYLLEGAIPFGGVVALATMDEDYRNWYDRLLNVQLVHWEPSLTAWGRHDVPPRRAMAGGSAVPAAASVAQPASARTAVPPNAPPPLHDSTWRPTPGGSPDADAGAVTTMTAPATERPPESAWAAPLPTPTPPPTPLPTCGLTAHLDNGDTLDLTSPILLGRDPSPSHAVPEGRPHPVLDLARSISKTHLAVGPDGAVAWAMDLRSTNGSSIERAGVTTPLVAWVRTELADGDVVHFGDRSLTVRAEAARQSHE